MGDLDLPSRRDRAIASGVSALVAIGIYLATVLVLGGLAVLAFGRDGFSIAAANDAASMRSAVAVLDSGMPAWVPPVVALAGAVVTWLAVSRVGLGLVGDAVGSVRGVGPDGTVAPRGRTLVRAGVPVAVAALGQAAGHGLLALALLVGCGVLAVLSADRRGPFERISGLRIESTAPVKGDREERRRMLRAEKAAGRTDS